jgi:hypothetical protein
MPPTVCPVSDAAQACQVTLAAAARIPPAAGQSFLEFRLLTAEDVLGVEVSGSATNYARTMTARWAETSSANCSDVDNGRLLPANWEGGHTARVLFEQPVQAGVLRIYPQDTSMGAASALLELSADAVVRRCGNIAGPQTDDERCNDLKCRSYCYRMLSCEGSWKDYCEQQKEQEQSCDVDCSFTTGIGRRDLGAIVSTAMILVAVMHGPPQM